MEFKGLTSASHMSLPEAGYGSEEGYVGSEISGAVSGVTTPGASRLQASQLQQRSTTMQRLHGSRGNHDSASGISLDHRTLAGLLLLLGHCVFPLRLHSWHLPSEPKIILLSVLTVAIDIGLEFILVLIVV